MARSTVYNKITTEQKLKEINSENLALIEDFMDYLNSIDRSPKTIYNYKSDLNIFFIWNLDFNNNKPFAKLTKRELSRFQNYAINEFQWSPKRIRRVKSTLSSLSNFIENILDEEEEYENFKPIIRKIENPADEVIREKTILSNEQVELLLNKLVELKEYEKACAIAICAYSGMRKSELLQMKMEYFDESHLVFGCLYKTDKVRSKGRGKLGKPINKYIMKKVDKYINLWRDERERLGINSEWVFVKKSKNYYVKRENIDSWTTQFSNILNVDFYYHSLRHFTCTILLSEYNLPAEVVREFFSWNSTEMLKIYNDRSAVDDFGKYFSADGIKKQDSNSFGDLN